MCRNIRRLFPFDPPTTDEEIRAAALQYVRKISGFTMPAKANEAIFEEAVAEISEASGKLIRSLETKGPAKNRQLEAAKARARFAARQA